jgi:hypothetical protein
MTNGQYIKLLQTHLDKLHTENYNLKNNIKDFSIETKVIPLDIYNNLKFDYENLVIKLKSYGLWTGE